MTKRILLLLLLLAIGYLALAPVPIDPVAWTPPVNPGFKGIYAPNDRLATVQKMAKGLCPECEDLAIDSSGTVYAGASDGRILVFSPDFKQNRTLAQTGGRPLGLAADNKGNIYVADGAKGLLWVSPQGQVTCLTKAYNGQDMLLVDDLALAPDSSIIFTEASRKFPLHTYKLDLLEHRPNGYLFQYDLKTRQTRQLLDSLYFANGVGVSNDGSYALVNDMGRYRVLKYHLTGVKKGQSEVFADNLPGFPDGLNIGSDGTVWLSIVSPRTTSLDFIMRYPFLRKLLLRLPESAQPAPQRYGCILGFDATGKLIHNLQDPKGGYAAITNCVPFQHKLYLGTLTEHSIGVYELR